MKFIKNLYLIILVLSFSVIFAFGEDLKLQKDNPFKPMLKIHNYKLKSAFLDKKDRLILIAGKEVFFIDLKTGKTIKSYKLNTHYYSDTIKFSPDGKYIVLFYTERSQVYIHNVEDGKLLHKIDTSSGKGFIRWYYYDNCENIIFSHDSKYLIADTVNGQGYDRIVVIDVNSGKIVKRIGLPYKIYGEKQNFLLSSNNRFLSLTSKDNICVLDLKTKNSKKFKIEHKKYINLMVFKEKKILFLKDYKTLEELDISNGNIKEIIQDDKERLNNITLSPTNSIFLSNNHKRSYIFTRDKSRFLSSLTSSSYGHAQFNQFGNKLLTYSSKDLHIWDMNPYNKDLAQKVYNSIDKKDYIALYEFTKKFYYKFDVVQQAYSEIYKAIKDKNDIDIYNWFVENLKYNKKYNWYQQNFGGFASSEMKDIEDRLYKLRQAKFAKEYEKVKKENNLVLYDFYALGHSSPKANNLTEAISNIHKMAFNKAKEINTILAYNTFIIAFPLAKEVEEANKLAYKLEKEKYTDIGLLGFIGKDEKLNKQARKLFIVIKQLYNDMPKGSGLGDIDNGYYLIIDRMYRLLKNEFAETDAYLTFLESDKLNEFKQILKMKKQELQSAWEGLASKEEKDVYPHLHLLMTTALSSSNSDKSMIEFYKHEKLTAKKWLNKNNDDSSENDFANSVNKKVENFQKIYEQVVSNYKPNIPKIENIQLSFDDSSSEDIESNTDETKTKYKNELSNSKIKMNVNYKVLGNKVHFKVVAKNIFSNSKGGISVSIPSIKYKKDIDSMKQNGFDSAKIYPSGSSLWSGSLKQKITSKYILIEGWSKKWSQNAEKSLQFSIDKNLIANKTVNIRAILVKNHKEYLLPTDGVTDQQDYPVKQITIDISKNSDNKNRLGTESVQSDVQKALEKVLNSWNKVMNDKDTSLLESLYANELKYYRKQLSSSKAIKDKQKALAKYPDFSQQIKNITYVEIEQNLYKVSFNKYVKASSTSEEKVYPSYLYIKRINDEWRIVKEGDKVTDKMLQDKESIN